MGWPDDVDEYQQTQNDVNYRDCLLASVEYAGGEWALDHLGSCMHPIEDESFWPTEPVTPSELGVILHTHDESNHAYRVPTSLYTDIPSDWYVVDGYVHWYCNAWCSDSGTSFEDGTGGCETRSGGIMDWNDNVDESDPQLEFNYRECLLESATFQGGTWNVPGWDCNFDGCAYDPCSNGAVCTDGDHGYEFTCDCATGYSGDNCEIGPSRMPSCLHT